MVLSTFLNEINSPKLGSRFQSGPSRSSFDMSCTDELTKSEAAAVY